MKIFLYNILNNKWKVYFSILILPIDFVLLSVHDLQLPENERIDKNELAAYVFLDDKCLDCLIIGSPQA